MGPNTEEGKMRGFNIAIKHKYSFM